MAHGLDGIEEKTNNVVGTVRAVFQELAPWHRFGFVNKDVISDGREFLKLARSHYDVLLRECLVDFGRNTLVQMREMVRSGNLRQIERLLANLAVVDNQFHCVRDEDRAVVSPKTVTERYQTARPMDLVDAMQPLVDEGHGVWDAAFVLDGGQREIVTVKLTGGENVSVPGDNSKHQQFLVLSNQHGTGAVSGTLTSIRVVCRNTANWAFEQGANFRLSHSKTVRNRIQTAVRVWEEANEAISRMNENMAAMANTAIGHDGESVDDLLVRILGRSQPEKESDDSGESKPPSTRLVNKAKDIANRVNDPTNGTFGQTYYDVYNAVTNHTTFANTASNPRSPDKIFAGNLSGTQYTLQKTAFEVLMEGATAKRENSLIVDMKPENVDFSSLMSGNIGGNN